MENHLGTANHVEDLERFGMSISEMPKGIFKGQGKIIFAKFRQKFGWAGMVPFVFRVIRERRLLLKRYSDQYAKLSRRTPTGAKEITLMIAMFNAIARDESRQSAYAFVKEIFQTIAPRSLPALYQLDDLLRCEGDVFDNFKKFNIAMFKAGSRDFGVSEIEESDNHLRIVVNSCLNVDAGAMFDCPEIAQLGCDHDLASYPHVEPLVHCEFRRPCTLAKGGCCCDFNFYRKGFSPSAPFINQ